MNEKDKNFFDRLDEIINSDNMQDIIDERLEYLDSEEYKSECEIKNDFYGLTSFIKGHIDKATPILIEDAIPIISFLFDDKDIYTQFLNNIRVLANGNNCPAKSSIKIALYKTIGDYFSRELSSEFLNKEWENMDKSAIRASCNIGFQNEWCKENGIEKSKDEPDIIPISISKIKGLGIGLCSEYAALSQQLLTFIGVESYYVASTCQLKKDDKFEAHAYNVMRTAKGIFIMDVVNENYGNVDESLEDVLYAKKQIRAGKYYYGMPSEEQKNKKDVDNIFDDI